MAPPGPAASTIDDVIEGNGPAVVGSLLQQGLFGISCVMAYDYFSFFSDDSKWLKGMVVWLMILNGLKSGLLFEIAWHKSVLHFGDWNDVGKSYISNSLSLLCSVLLAATSQAFFGSIAFRALNRNYYFLALVLTILALSFAGGFGLVTNLLFMSKADINAVKYLPEIWWWAMLSGDVVITSVLVWKFKMLAKGAGDQTKSLLTGFIALSLRTAALTTACVLAERILHLADLEMQAQIPGTLIGGLFVISAIHTLTSRKTLQTAKPEDARSRSRIPRFGFGTKSGAVTTRNGGPEHGAHTEVRFETHILQEMTHNPDLPKAKPLINGDEDLHNNEKPFDGNPYATHAY